MNGIPMVATSPVRHHDSPVMNPVEIHSYEPPWKALCDFALHSDLDRPGYNHLVNEVSNYLAGHYISDAAIIMGLTKITL